MLKPKLMRQDQGFTLAEALVAILIVSVFSAVSMQAMVHATAFKSKAQEFSEATTWIQEDLENLKYQASQYNSNPNDVGLAGFNVRNTRCTAGGPENGYADGLSDRLMGIKPETVSYGTGAGTDTADTVKTLRSGKSYRLRKTMTPVTTAPYAVLRVNYNVVLSSNTSTAPCPEDAIACVYAEVIPDAVFQCP